LADKGWLTSSECHDKRSKNTNYHPDRTAAILEGATKVLLPQKVKPSVVYSLYRTKSLNKKSFQALFRDTRNLVEFHHHVHLLVDKQLEFISNFSIQKQ
jgi:hypothetical protein